MYGEHIGSLSVITSSRGTAAAWRVISGDQGNQWLTAMIDITLVRNDRVSVGFDRPGDVLSRVPSSVLISV